MLLNHLHDSGRQEEKKSKNTTNNYLIIFFVLVTCQNNLYIEIINLFMGVESIGENLYSFTFLLFMKYIY